MTTSVPGSSPARATVPAFAGFPAQALDFYQGLQADNSRSYWQDHQEVYANTVRGPMLALVDGLEAEFGTAKLFRPHRDVRFSRDKSPYKTHLGAVLGGTLYVQLSGDGLYVGGGYYQLSADQLVRYRARVQDERRGPALAAVAAELTGAGIALIGDRLLRAPRGVDPTHPRVELLRHKGLAAARDFGAPAWLGTRRALSEVAALWRRLAPLIDWLEENVGPPEPTEGDPAVPRGGVSRPARAAGGSSARSR